ncbi:MAG: sugar phosphate isomerase/epimerase [Anaerolineae bacterium]|nr:sugar phosphate isomerase/epimerase [Anaerolineae bacterium]
MEFGINLGFAVKRLPGASEWARFVREQLKLDLVQFSFDLIDPFMPLSARSALTAQVRQAVRDFGLTIHSAQVGLACYTYNGLLHPDSAARKAALQWWINAVEIAAELEVPAVGGPLGGMSIPDARDPKTADRRYRDALDALAQVSQAAKTAGLRAILVEPTPLKREYPHTVEQAAQLLADLEGRAAVPVEYVLDIGHALYQPLYGQNASLRPWFDAVGRSIGVLHLQNTDFQSDSHWGWPDARAAYDVTDFAAQVQAAALGHLPVFLEVFYAFEADDDSVLANTISSVRHCQSALGLSQG